MGVGLDRQYAAQANSNTEGRSSFSTIKWSKSEMKSLVLCSASETLEQNCYKLSLPRRARMSSENDVSQPVSINF